MMWTHREAQQQGGSGGRCKDTKLNRGKLVQNLWVIMNLEFEEIRSLFMNRYSGHFWIPAILTMYCKSTRYGGCIACAVMQHSEGYSQDSGTRDGGFGKKENASTLLKLLRRHLVASHTLVSPTVIVEVGEVCSWYLVIYPPTIHQIVDIETYRHVSHARSRSSTSPYEYFIQLVSWLHREL